MLLKWLLSLMSLVFPNGHQNVEQNTVSPPKFVPTAYGPKTLEEEALARKALHGEHYGGDMVLPRDWNTSDAGIADVRYRWPGYPGGAEIPFVIDQSALDLREKIYMGMQQYHDTTCIRFVERANQTDFIRIFSGNGCYSAIGRNGGMQELSLGEGCAYIGVVVHELGHAIGLFHEHQRSDRDKYITIHKDNVIPGQLHNFWLTDSDKELIFTPYAYPSIMHYGNYAFSKEPNKLPTMVAHDGYKLFEPYEKPGLIRSDIYAIWKLYQCQLPHMKL